MSRTPRGRRELVHVEPAEAATVHQAAKRHPTLQSIRPSDEWPPRPSGAQPSSDRRWLRLRVVDSSAHFTTVVRWPLAHVLAPRPSRASATGAYQRRHETCLCM